MDPIRIGAQAVTSIPSVIEPSAVADGKGAQEGRFLHQLKDAIAQANDVQLQASHAVDELVTGKTQNIHQAMVALQQADISFQLMMQVRNKLVGAYEEIQRMQI
jgi:flagellar hook-basal body complex protein FliE